MIERRPLHLNEYLWRHYFRTRNTVTLLLPTYLCCLRVVASRHEPSALLAGDLLRIGCIGYVLRHPFWRPVTDWMYWRCIEARFRSVRIFHSRVTRKSISPKACTWDRHTGPTWCWGGGASGTIFGNNADYYASAYFACGQFRCSLLAVSWYVRVTLYKFRVLYQ